MAGLCLDGPAGLEEFISPREGPLSSNGLQPCLEG